MKMDALNEARNILASLPLFAQGLAGQAKVEVVISARATTASTNGRRVTLPPLPLPNSEADVEATLKLAMLSRGFIVHEIGHVLNTDFGYMLENEQVFKDRLVKSIWNALEDPWQEAATIRRFRGARAQLDQMTESMIGHPNFYNVLTEDKSPMWLVSAYCLYLLRGDIREQPAFQALAEQSRPAMVKVFGEGFTARLEILMDVHGPKLNSTEAATALAQRIVKAMQDEAEKPKEPEQPKQPDQGENGSGGDDSESEDEDESQGSDDSSGSDTDDAGDDGDGSSGAGDQKGDTDGEGSGNGGGDGDDDTSGADDAAGDGDKSSSGADDAQAGVDKSDSGNGGKAVITEANSKALQDALDGNGEQLEDLGDSLAREIDGTIEEIEEHGAVGHVKDDDTSLNSLPGMTPLRRAYTTGKFDPAPALAQSGRLRALMTNELQSLQLLREHEAPRGNVLNERRIHRTGSGDRRLFLQIDERKQLNTAVFLLADVSGSMHGEPGQTNSPVMLESQALFATAVALNSLNGVSTAVGTFPGFGMVLNFGERAALNVQNFSLGTFGCTPMGEGILWATRHLMTRREERKILIVATDGAPDSHQLAKAQIGAAEGMGIECMGLGIRLPMISTLFQKHAVIQSIDEISGAMLSMVRGALRSQLQAA